MINIKIGLFYEDNKTGELLMCMNFIRTEYCWLNCKGEYFKEEKWDARKHIDMTATKNKNKINEFMNNLNKNGYELKKDEFGFFDVIKIVLLKEE